MSNERHLLNKCRMTNKMAAMQNLWRWKKVLLFSLDSTDQTQESWVSGEINPRKNPRFANSILCLEYCIFYRRNGRGLRWKGPSGKWKERNCRFLSQSTTFRNKEHELFASEPTCTRSNGQIWCLKHLHAMNNFTFEIVYSQSLTVLSTKSLSAMLDFYCLHQKLRKYTCRFRAALTTV